MSKTLGNKNTRSADTSAIESNISSIQTSVNTILSSTNTTQTLNQLNVNSIEVLQGNINLQSSEQSFKINNTNVLSSNSLGTNIIYSLLTQVGSSLTLGIGGPRIFTVKTNFTNVANSSQVSVNLPTTSTYFFVFMCNFTSATGFSYGYGCLYSTTLAPAIVGTNSQLQSAVAISAGTPQLRFTNTSGSAKDLNVIIFCFSAS